MYVGDKHIVALDHQGGTVDYSNNGYAGTIYIAAPSNDTSYYYFYCNIRGESDTYIRLDLIPLSKKVGSEFKGWYSQPDCEGYRVFDNTGSLIMTGNLKGFGAKNWYYLYAGWRLISVPINVDNGEGTGSVSLFYYNVDNGCYYSDQASTQGVAMLPVPTKAGHRFIGYYSSASGGTKYVNADGSFTSALTPSAPITIYAQWQQVSRHITLDLGGGTGGTENIYYRISGGGIYLDETCENVATSIQIPSKSNARFTGLYSAAFGGTKYIDETGVILSSLSSMTIATDITIYAQWVNLYTITLSKDGGSGGAECLWYDSSTGKYYSDSTYRIEVSSIVPPTKAGNTFLGYFSSTSGGTKYINADGSFTAELPTPTQNLTFYAHWDLKAFVLYLDSAGGERAPDKIFYKPEQGWFLDEGCTSQISSIETPLRSGYTYGGYFSGQTLVISTTGVIMVATLASDMNAAASWTAMSFTLTFDYKGGTSSGVTSKTVTMGQPVGVLPTSEKTGRIFGGWKVLNIEITETSIWNIASDSTAVANWVGYIGNCPDYFGFSCDQLIPISSDSGDNKKRICVSHVGPYEPGVNAISNVWRNPTVVYRVVGDITFNAVLGRAYSSNGRISGYMITEVEVNTSIGEFPTVRISAVANEGYNAINLFPVSVQIQAKAHAQPLLASVSGGGELQDLTLTAKCNPVVVAENMMPCASDVVCGQISVSANTIAARNEAAPVAAGGFVAVDEPKRGADGSCIKYSITVEKEI